MTDGNTGGAPCRYIIYHDDADGRCAAAIVRRNAQVRGLQVCLLTMRTYADPVPDVTGLGFRRDMDELWIVDFSFPVDVMDQMKKFAGAKFFWFDHHKSVLDRYGQDAGMVQAIGGIRRVGTAACLLVWQYLHPGERVPAGVMFIADRDVWRFEHGDRTRWFYDGYLQMDSRPGSKFWDRLLDRLAGDEMTGYLLNSGCQLYGARIKGLKSQAQRLGIEMPMAALSAAINQDLKVLRMNYPGSGDLGHLVVEELGFDVCWCWVEQKNGAGRLVRINSVYSNKVDVAAIAVAHGGGGHAGAAGWEEFI